MYEKLKTEKTQNSNFTTFIFLILMKLQNGEDDSWFSSQSFFCFSFCLQLKSVLKKLEYHWMILSILQIREIIGRLQDLFYSEFFYSKRDEYMPNYIYIKEI